MRLRAIGIQTDQARAMVEQVQKWSCSTGSGEEWTVERLKDIKLLLLHHFSGLPPAETKTWIKVRADGTVKGPFRGLFLLSKREFAKAWNAILIYTGFVFNHPDLRITRKQWKKMVDAVMRPALTVEATVNSLAMTHQSPFRVSLKVRGETGSALVDYPVSPTRRAPGFWETVPEEEGVLDSFIPLYRRVHWTQQNWDILQGTVRGFEGPVLDTLEINLSEDARSPGIDPTDLRPEMGLISLIQEPGYKLRFAANPYRVYQMALQPLGNALFDALRRVPNDFTFDQQGGIDFVQRLLGSGLPAASMDLSNATDNAPLDAQLELLGLMGVSTRWLQFFRDTCRGDWYVSTSRSSGWQLLRWSVGSPLGLYPTFASFALWHHSVVQYCFSMLDCPKLDNIYPYAIVGDDVVILNWEVANLYRTVMSEMGVPISESKTLWSRTTAEFLGRVITPSQVFQGFKWKGRCTDESFVDFARNIGPGSLILMRDRQRRVLNYIADLPYPYGLGWNPLGIPLEERLTPDIENIWSRDERVRTFSRRAARVARLLYMSKRAGGAVLSRELDAAFLASDQEAEEVLHYLLPGWNLGVEMWGNLQEIARLRAGMSPDILENIRLMLQRTSYVERRTEVPTLVVLERKIRSVLARGR